MPASALTLFVHTFQIDTSVAASDDEMMHEYATELKN